MGARRPAGWLAEGCKASLIIFCRSHDRGATASND